MHGVQHSLGEAIVIALNKSAFATKPNPDPASSLDAVMREEGDYGELWALFSAESGAAAGFRAPPIT